MYQVDIDTVNLVLQYLSNKPYIEVAQMIEALKQGVVVDKDTTEDE